VKDEEFYRSLIKSHYQKKMEYRMPDPDIQGWMSPEELEWLYQKAKEMATIVGIGSWKGRSTHALLSGCKGIVYAVDHFKGSRSEREWAHAEAKTEDIHEIFIKNVGHFKNLITMEMDSVETSKLFKDKETDMVFIDGDHAYPAIKKDIEAWMPKCKRLLCGHDIDQDGTPTAFKELNLTPKKEVGSLWSIEL
jgi:predicted O-methyltransferase YrrM